jgi:hypothetical protein
MVPLSDALQVSPEEVPEESEPKGPGYFDIYGEGVRILFEYDANHDTVLLFCIANARASAIMRVALDPHAQS